MSKLFQPERGKYTVIPDNITRDKDLDNKCRGMLLTLLSLPDSWHFSIRGLVTLYNSEGKAAIQTALNKLEELGYLKRVQERNPNGLLGDMNYYIYYSRQ